MVEDLCIWRDSYFRFRVDVLENATRRDPRGGYGPMGILVTCSQ